MCGIGFEFVIFFILVSRQSLFLEWRNPALQSWQGVKVKADSIEINYGNTSSLP
jgi:hypothetical protein